MTKGESSLEEKRDEIYESFHVLFPCGDSVDFRKKVKVLASKSREEGVRRVNYRTMRSMDRAQIALSSAATEFMTRRSTEPF